MIHFKYCAVTVEHVTNMINFTTSLTYSRLHTFESDKHKQYLFKLLKNDQQRKN